MGLAGALGDREAFGRDAANTPDLELGQQTKNGRGRGRVLEGAVGEKKKKNKKNNGNNTMLVDLWSLFSIDLFCFILVFFFLLLLLFFRLYLLAFVRGPVTALSFGLVILRSSLGYTFSALSR